MARMKYCCIVISLMLSVFCAPRVSVKETGITQLVQVTTDLSFEIDPSFSPDGQTIVFVSNRSGAFDIWMCSAIGGGGFTQLTMSTGISWDRAPRFSPDGKVVIFQSDRVAGVPNIWSITIGDRGLAQLTNNAYGCYYPFFSPRGNKIVFVMRNQNGVLYIWTMNPDGSRLTQLTEGTDPYYSPDGSKIAFSKKTKGNWDIWIMNEDGTNLVQITSDPERHEFAPNWSPDGKQIAYMAQFSEKELLAWGTGGGCLGCLWPFKKSRVLVRERRTEIWVKDLAGGRRETQLTAFEGINAYPCWSPDGKKIVFASDRAGNWDIWTMIPSR